MAESGPKARKPQDWEKVLSVAYLLSLGQTRATAAEAAGVGERTIYDWENEPWWSEAVDEAGRRWLSGVRSKAKRALDAALDNDDAFSARWALERLVPELAPPKVKQELTGADGSALAVQIIVGSGPSNADPED